MTKPEGRQFEPIKRAQNAIDKMIRESEESGDLAHLYGSPLDLEQDGSEWLVNRFVKQAGFSHPVLEQSKELDRLSTDSQLEIDRLRRRRDRLASMTAPAASDVRGFNEDRARVLERYRESLLALNRATVTFNLGATAALHRRTVNVERAVEQLATELPPLALSQPTKPAPPAPTRPRFWRPRTRGGA